MRILRSGVERIKWRLIFVYVEMKITIDSIELKKGKTLRGNEVGGEKKTREKEQKRTKRTARGVKTIFIAGGSLTGAYAYQCCLVVRAHPASSAVITLRFPTIGSPACPRESLGRLRRRPPPVNQLDNPMETSTNSQ